MDTARLKRFAQYARRYLREQVTTRLEIVLSQESAARREKPDAVQELEKAIREVGKERTIDRVAYTWFNRFCALRFMDVNRYNRIGVVSPDTGQFQPEILAEAKAGHIDGEMVPESARRQILGLLDGSIPSPDGQTEAYRRLIVAVCNDYHRVMPFLFERIDDYTELLMPDDLLSGDSILAYTREAMTPENCESVESIGWLYQFYISEKKDEVFDGLKKNQKITPENIPAATQLFTPHWIVKYLVENSLGRLWMLNRPNSRLIEKMEYYIKPAEEERDFLRLKSPEEIKICDPACGSGHILTYAFDLLYAIYEEEGYSPSDIPTMILTRNLYGIEIDDRAGTLAAFALVMKAREKQRRFFRNPIEPNICILENVRFESEELKSYLDFVGRDLFTSNLVETLHQFEEADNFGSLIRPTVTDVSGMLDILRAKDAGGNLFLYQTHEKVLRVLKQADYLSPKYHVAIVNPPYMGSKGMNPRLSAWVKDNYPDSKPDLFAMFIERSFELILKKGYSAMVTMQSWMFLSSYEKLRINILNRKTILSMVHLGARAFDSIGGEVVQTTAFIGQNNHELEYKGQYLRLVEYDSEIQKSQAIKEAIKNPDSGWFYRASAADFKKIPGAAIAYWVSQNILSAFDQLPLIKNICEPKSGLSTTDNNSFLRYWYEVNFQEISFETNDIAETANKNFRWYPFSKGGDYRKWYGNHEFVVNWWNNGADIRKATKGAAGGRIVSPEFYFKKGVTWSGISSSKPSMRTMKNSIFGSGGKGLFSHEKDDFYLAFLNSKVALHCLSFLSPTLNYEAGHIGNLPIRIFESSSSKINEYILNLIKAFACDWNFYETSWDFTILLILNSQHNQLSLNVTYNKLRQQWQETTLEMRRLEEENNRIFIEAYGLKDELTPEVPLKEITLTCNPYYRYNANKSPEELETLLLADTMREFISYSVGCMFGRYSLDKLGLILANQGDTLEEYLKQIPEPTFPPTETNVIPILDGDWFADDISERFKQFLLVTFGQEHYAENLKFIHNALGIKKDIREYFLKDFYNDHIKRYKKRPIYWLFSSPKGSFSALIYLHRYRLDTVSVILNDYLREYRTKLTSRKENLQQIERGANITATEKTKAIKEIEKLNKVIQELEDYERDILYPLATRQLQIDLDDGVKVNYSKFGKALKTIPGMTKESD